MLDTFLSLLGTGGLVMVIAFLLNTVDKKLTSQGLFADLGDMAEKLGSGLGKAVSGFIPGSKVEPELDDFVEKFQKLGNQFVDGFQSDLTNENDNSE